MLKTSKRKAIIIIILGVLILIGAFYLVYNSKSKTGLINQGGNSVENSDVKNGIEETINTNIDSVTEDMEKPPMPPE
jgi:hypothetical protein